MSDQIQQEILDLTVKWRNVLTKSNGVHKDRDCHWCIETVWSYGQDPEYYVRHYGYIFEEVNIACSSYEVALKELKKVIQRAIKTESEN